MGSHSTIEWTEATWNPTTGCTKAGGPGCDACYAIRESRRHLRNPSYEGVLTEDRRDWSGRVNLLHDRLDVPLRWRRPRLVFVDSMSDLFHPEVPHSFIAEVYARMGLAERHTFQVLTKRPGRAARLLASAAFQEQWYEARHRRAVQDDVQRMANRQEISLAIRWPLPNAWLGTSIETDPWTMRARAIVGAPAAVHFLSLEPLLGPLPSLDLAGIDWVIVGGESGPGARPVHPQWVNEVLDHCLEAGVAFFFKQWGEWAPVREVYPADESYLADAPLDAYSDECSVLALEDDGCQPEGETPGGWWCDYQPRPERNPWWVARLGKRAAGRQLGGRTWDELPQPAAAAVEV